MRPLNRIIDEYDSNLEICEYINFTHQLFHFKATATDLRKILLNLKRTFRFIKSFCNQNTYD